MISVLSPAKSSVCPSTIFSCGLFLTLCLCLHLRLVYSNYTRATYPNHRILIDLAALVTFSLLGKDFDPYSRLVDDIWCNISDRSVHYAISSGLLLFHLNIIPVPLKGFPLHKPTDFLTKCLAHETDGSTPAI